MHRFLVEHVLHSWVYVPTVRSYYTVRPVSRTRFWDQEFSQRLATWPKPRIRQRPAAFSLRHLSWQVVILKTVTRKKHRGDLTSYRVYITSSQWPTYSWDCCIVSWQGRDDENWSWNLGSLGLIEWEGSLTDGMVVAQRLISKRGTTRSTTLCRRRCICETLRWS